MAVFPLARYVTFVANKAPVITAAFLNAAQDAIVGLYAGTLSVANLLVDATGDAAVALTAGTIAMVTGGALDVEGTNADTGAALLTTYSPTHRKLWAAMQIDSRVALYARIYYDYDDSAFEIVINAAWNGTQWVPDHGASPSTRLMLTYSSPFFVLSSNTGGVSFNDASWSTLTSISSLGAVSALGGFIVPSKFGLTNNGVVNEYNGEGTTDGVGVPYIPRAAVAVAWGGASTPIVDYAPISLGLYRVTVVISAHTNNDTVTATVVYKDAVDAVTTTITLINGVTLTHDDATAGTVQATAVIHAATGHDIVLSMTVAGQVTTKASGAVERLV